MAGAHLPYEYLAGEEALHGATPVFPPDCDIERYPGQTAPGHANDGICAGQDPCGPDKTLFAPAESFPSGNISFAVGKEFPTTQTDSSLEGRTLAVLPFQYETILQDIQIRIFLQNPKKPTAFIVYT